MDEIGIKAIFEDAEFQKGLSAFIKGLELIQKATQATAASVETSSKRTDSAFTQSLQSMSKIAHETAKDVESSTGKAADSLDLNFRQAARGVGEFGRLADMSGITQGLGNITGAASMAASGIQSFKNEFLGLPAPVLAAIAAMVALAFAISKVREAYDGSTPSLKALNDELYKAGKPAEDATQGLADLLGVSRNIAATYVELVKTSPQFREELRKMADDAQPARKAIEDLMTWLDAADKRIKESQKASGIIAPTLLFTPVPIDVDTEALAKHAAAIKAADAASNDYYARMKVAGKSAGDIAVANQTKIDALRDSYTDKEKSAGQQIVSIDTAVANQRESIAASLVKSIRSINEGLQQSNEQAERNWGRQLESFARDRARIETDLAKTLAQIGEDSAKQRNQIEKELQKSIASLNRDTARSLQKVDEDLASSYHDIRTARGRREARQAAAKNKADILEQAAQRLADLNTAAQEKRDALAEQTAERRKDAEAEAADRRIALAEQIKIARELVEYQKAEAKRQADYQIEQAKRQAKEQIAEANAKALKDKQIVKQTLADEATDINTKITELGGNMGVAGKKLGVTLVTSMAAGINESAWMVKNAIGNLTGAYAASYTGDTKGFATRHAGGYIPASQPYNLLAGEYVLNRGQVAMLAPMLKGGATNNYTFSHNWNGAPPSDKAEIERVVEAATYKSMAKVLGKA
jgi:hypothetical protein